MSEELIITKEDLVAWIDRPLSHDDLDLIDFITTRLENFYKLEVLNKKLQQQIKNYNICFNDILNRINELKEEIILNDKK